MENETGSVLYDYVGGEYPIYIGYASRGNTLNTGEPIWDITKLTYDVNNNITLEAWADVDKTNPVSVWNNRTSYTYT